MKTFIFAVAMLAFVSSVQAQQVDLITNTDGRKTVALDGDWQTIVDPYESGFYDYRYQPSANGYFKNAKPKSPTDLIEYDFDKADTLKVPGDWNTQSDKLFFYEGTIWYKKSFDYQRRPIFLRGVCLHEEAPVRGGRAYSREDALTLLAWAKELGANFVRLAHYPHNEFMIREADRMGIMVWSEIPVYWTILWDNPATLENARNQLSEMIVRDKNRASVVIWSVANETPLSDARLTFLKNLVSHARSLDSTRLLSAAMERHYIDATTQMIDDPLGEYLDVLGCNEYVGWYDGLPSKADRLEWKSKYEKPLIMSEFGGDALHGHHGEASTRWTEEYQEDLYRHQLIMLKRIPFLRGTAPWILMDFRSPRRPLPGIQDYWNRKGLVSNRGEKKKAFYVMQQWYRELQEARQ